MSANKNIGKIGWIDLSVPNADVVRDFYSRVVGWEFSPVTMGEYDDYVMLTPGEQEAVAGICHNRGTNSCMPPGWIIYITVENIEKSMAECEKLGGEICMPPKEYGNEGRYCVIKGPSGSVAALYQKNE